MELFAPIVLAFGTVLGVVRAWQVFHYLVQT